ncbi:MAG: type IV secretion system DNA-binding domain-containing protein [Anaerolineales bacterium]|nr:type IV secretion system DNA-binding domain-containing protein [Anaerolineales bacterium]
MPDEHLISRRRTGERLLIYACVSVVYAVFFGVGGLVGILLVYKRKDIPKPWLYALSGFSVLWAMMLFFTHAYDNTLRYWLIYAIPLGGLSKIVVQVLLILHEWYLNLPSWDHTLHVQEARYERRKERDVESRLSLEPTREYGIEIGLVIEKDARALNMDAFQLQEDYLWADEQFLNQHLLLIGAPGSGKSEAIKHLIAQVLAKTQRDVFIVDGKGERDFAYGAQRLFYDHRQTTIPVFQMGTQDRGDPYNGFVGTPEAIKQRLTAMFNVEQQIGDGEFYANINRALLNLVCFSPEGTPRSLSELDERLSLSWLRYCYRHDPRKLRAIERYEPYFDGFRLRADSLIWDFEEYLSPEGFSLDGVSGAVFSLRTAAMGDTSRRFLNFLIEDFKDWVGKRQQRPALLVIDEFGQFENQSIIALIELARSANLGILLATQDLSTVRERHIRERILSSVQTKILMKTDTPEVIGELAGTFTAPHLTYQMDEIDLTGLGSIRLEEQRKVNLNAVRRFPPGRAYVIRSGVGTIVQFRQVAA